MGNRKGHIDVNPYEASCSPPTDEADPTSEHGSYHQAIVIAAAQQAFVLLFAALLLDGGHLLRAFSVAIAAFWAIAFIVILYRWRHPTAFTVAFVKWGFWFAVLLLLVMGTITSLMGV